LTPGSLCRCQRGVCCKKGRALPPGCAGSSSIKRLYNQGEEEQKCLKTVPPANTPENRHKSEGGKRKKKTLLNKMAIFLGVGGGRPRSTRFLEVSLSRGREGKYSRMPRCGEYRKGSTTREKNKRKRHPPGGQQEPEEKPSHIGLGITENRRGDKANRESRSFEKG